MLGPFFEQLSEDQRGPAYGGDGRRRARWIAELAEFHVSTPRGSWTPPRRELMISPEEGLPPRGAASFAAGGAKAVKGSRYALPEPRAISPRPRASRSRGWPGEDKFLHRAYFQSLGASACATCSRPAAAREARLRLESWLASACRNLVIDEVKELPRLRGATRTPSSGPRSSASPTPGRGHQQQDRSR